jgi:2,4-dienoyl-CoA reductase-like NADH-dependent reductase (Old Yellow Enzyme family)
LKYKLLFSPISINKMKLDNRITMAPTHDGLASSDGFVTPRLIEAYLKRGKGEVGLIVVGGVQATPDRYPFLLRVSDDKFVPGIKEFTGRIHSETRAKICAQITDSLKIGRHWKQNVNDLAPEYINNIIENFEKGSVRAREGGFDAIEIHAAHGYTLSSFLSLRNKREDGYGGNIDGRLRLLFEVYDRVRDLLGPDFPIGMRINGDEFIIDGNTLQQSRIIARKMAERGIDYVSVTAGGKFEDSAGVIPKYEIPANYPPFGGYSGFRAMPPAWMPEAVNVYLAAAIRKAIREAGFSTPVITAGRIPYPRLAEEILEEEKADLIALSRPLLRDPEWALKAREGREKQIKRCTYCNTCIERLHLGEPGICKYMND